MMDTRRRPPPHFKGWAWPVLLLFLTLPFPLRGQQPQPCSAPEFRQFDFWLGDWEVRKPDGTIAGENTIQKSQNGCVLAEAYHTPTGYSGQSLNIYDASRGVWHQSWVDVGGLLLILEGGYRDGAMVLEGETNTADGPVKQRIRWSVLGDDPDQVRQLWETSTDGGRSWSVAFDGLYVRKGQEASP